MRGGVGSSFMAGVKDQINADLKTAMLARDKPLTLVLQSLKSAILYKEVETGTRDTGLPESDILAVLKKEKKSRLDSLALYVQAGEKERANEESYQISVIDTYVPEALDADKTRELVLEAIADLGLDSVTMKDMGVIMQAVKAKNDAVEGSVVSQIIKERSEG